MFVRQSDSVRYSPFSAYEGIFGESGEIFPNFPLISLIDCHHTESSFFSCNVVTNRVKCRHERQRIKNTHGLRL